MNMEKLIYHIHMNSMKQSKVPKCLTCGSTNIRKIGGVERGASIAAFGIFIIYSALYFKLIKRIQLR